jgi:ABC-type Na+ transport system ATPase subunit NatA
VNSFPATYADHARNARTREEAMVEPVISVQHLQKRYGDTVAVEDVTLSVRQGEIFGIAGPNGAGKTTSVECMQGLRHPDGGEIRVLGLDPVRDGQKLRQRIGSQLQQSALPDRIRVWEALDLFASFVPGESNWPALIDQWGLTGKENTAFADLSGGQQQRLFIALSLIGFWSLALFYPFVEPLVFFGVARHLQYREVEIRPGKSGHKADRIAQFEVGQQPQ